MLTSRREPEQFVIAVEVGAGAAVEGKSRVCEWDELDPDVPLLLPQAPHGRTFLPNHPSADLSVMAWLLAPWCSDFSLRSLASWLKLELPIDDGAGGGGRGGSALVQATRQLYAALRAHLEAAGLWELYRRVEQPLGHVLRKMEAVGVPVVGGTVDLRGEKRETQHQWRGWPARWTSLTGRVHPRWCQTTAITGRISAQDPPLQSLPRRLRDSVAAPDGRVLVAADLSGADFRAACAMSGDPTLHQMFEQRDDPYAVIGRGAGPEGHGKERVIGKGIALAALYDAKPRTMATDLGLSVKAVQNALTQYRGLFPRLWQWRDELLERFHAGQELRNPFGRRLAPESRAQAINHPCQSAVADLMKLAMVRLDGRLPAGAAIIAQVHDELLVECFEKDAATVAGLMVQEMTRPQPELPVPLAVKVGDGRTWAEATAAQDSGDKRKS